MPIFGGSSRKRREAAEEQHRQLVEQQKLWDDAKAAADLKKREDAIRQREEKFAAMLQERLRLEDREAQIKADEARMAIRRQEENERHTQDLETARLVRIKRTSPEALRELRDLIRRRYHLDMYIWSLKGARAPDRPLVQEEMEKADAVLFEIYSIVETWEEDEWTPEEWRMASKIKQQVLMDGKRWWENNPPWNEV